MFEIMEQLKDLEAPVNDLQMADILLRSLPNQMCYGEKVWSWCLYFWIMYYADHLSDISAEDQQLTNEVLENSSLPEYASDVAFEETQRGDDKVAGNSASPSTKCQEDDGSEGSRSDGETEDRDNEDIDSDIGDENVTDLVEAADGEDISDDVVDYDYLFDPDDELEAENSRDGDPPAEVSIDRQRIEIKG
eukprot:jgi/Phyca11/12605/fgenesh1_pg.PHYCAscaffold_1_\